MATMMDEARIVLQRGGATLSLAELYTLVTDNVTIPPAFNGGTITLQLSVNANGADGLATPKTGSLLQLGGSKAGMQIDAMASTPSLAFRRINGTVAAPTSTLSGQVLGEIDASGYAATKYGNSNRAEIVFYATENWDDGKMGTGMSFNVNTDGTVTQSCFMTGISKSGTSGIALFGSNATSGLPVTGATASIQTTGKGGILTDRMILGTTSGAPTFTSGAGAPSTVEPKGSIRIRNDGSVGANFYINQDGASAWAAVPGV